jgi:site-specific DNA recombinase
MGLLFGPTGDAMSPTHTRRRGRLYRYYISQAVLKRGKDACPIGRVSAAKFEAAVLAQLWGLLSSPEIIIATWRSARKENTGLREHEVRESLLQFEVFGSSFSRPSRPASFSC